MSGFKTKIGPDGSLPYITSSFKGVTSNFKIAKVPEDEIGESGMVYKLIFTGEYKESESEKSDEEAWSDSNSDVPNINHSEKDKSMESLDFNYNQPVIGNKSQNVESGTRYDNGNRNRRNHFRYSNYDKRNNTHNSFNNPKLMASSKDERKHFNTNKRDFGFSGNYGKSYNQNLPEPWARPPIVHPAPNYPFAPFFCTSYDVSPLMNPLRQAPPNSAIDHPSVQNQNALGHFDSSPYIPTRNFSRRLDFQPIEQNEDFSSPHPTNYQASNNEDEFPPHPSNYQTGNINEKQNNTFRGRQNYNEMYNNYPDDHKYPNDYRYESNPQRVPYGEQKWTMRGRYNWKRNNPEKQWTNGNKKYQNSYNNRHPSYRTQENDKRNANAHFGFRN